VRACVCVIIWLQKYYYKDAAQPQSQQHARQANCQTLTLE
jgi:hypothetical protein